MIHKFENIQMDDLRSISDNIKDKNDDIVIVIASVSNGKILFLASVAKDLTKKGFNAGQIVRYVAQKTGGNGGGRPDFASAGGKDIDKVDEALSGVVDFLEEK